MTRKEHFDAKLDREQIESMSLSSVPMDRWLAAIAAGQTHEDWSLNVIWRLKADGDDNTRNAALNAIRLFPQKMLISHQDDTLAEIGEFIPSVWKYRPLPEYDEFNKNIYFAAIIDILNTEGPTTGNRVERLLSKGTSASNNRRFSKSRTKMLLDQLVKRNSITRADGFLGSEDIDRWILHIPGTPEYVIRDRADRLLTEIPVNEARAVYLQDISIDENFPDRDLAINILIEHYGIATNELHKIGAAMETQWETLFIK